MSNYAGADKVTGNTFTAAEFNDLKTAINSKLDALVYSDFSQNIAALDSNYTKTTA